MKHFVSACAAIVTLGQPATAQDAMTLMVSPDTAACLVEHQDVYLDIPQPVLFFFLALCPDPLGDELGALVQNSEIPAGQTMERVIMLKSDFACMLQRIDEQMPEDAETEDDALMTLVLDCA